MSTDHNLLFGVLALQMDLLDATTFAEACSAWATRKDVSLADLLVERGWLTSADRADVQRLLERKLKRHGGDAHASLAAVATPGVRRALEDLADPGVRQTLADLPAPTPPDPSQVSTIAHELGSRQRYTLTRLHAQGGIGRVWLAHDEELGRDVALKELRPDQGDNPAVVARFLEEAKITGQLEHPGVVPVYELVRPEDGRPCYAMRFVGGRTLADAIQEYHRKHRAGQAGPLDLRGLLTAFVGVCNAVAYAHSRGVLHRDLKPQNVGLGEYGEVLVLDWGLAKVLGQAEDPASLLPVSVGPADGAGLTQQGQVLGTPAYMAPEQARGRPDLVDKRSDVYGLGAILYEVLGGVSPFRGADTLEVLKRVVEEPPVPPRQLVPATPPALEAVCLKALAKKPEQRYASARDLGRDVERWLADEPVGAWREPLRVRAGRWTRRHQTGVAAAAAAVLVALLLGGGGAVLLGRQQAERRAEQSRQEVQLREGIDAALAEVTRLQGQARWGEALAVVTQAAGRLGDNGPEDLRARVGKAREALDLVARLDAIRLSRATSFNGVFDYAGADRRYADAFAAAGLARPGEEPRVVAGRVRASPVSGPIVAALDDWAACTHDAARRVWLLAAARMADPDPWRDRARAAEAWTNRSALEALAAQAAAADQSPHLVVPLARRLQELGGDAVGLLRRAQERHPDDFWLNFELGFQLRERQAAASLGYCRAALALRPGAGIVMDNLARALQNQGQLNEAVVAYRAAIRLDPRDSWPRKHLGDILFDQGMKEEALEEYRTAVRLDPRDASAHSELANILSDLGKLDAAEEEYRAAIRLDPKDASAHNDLGLVLHDQGKPDAAAAEYRTAIRLDPEWALPHDNLGDVLSEQGRPEEAEREYRAAVRLDPKDGSYRFDLAELLKDRGRLEEAKKEYEEALGLGSREAEEGLRQCERLLPLVRRLPAVLRGEDRPASALEMLGFAEVCSLAHENRTAAAARFCEQAFAADPKLADDLKAGHRYNAACYAALAGCGQGKDAAKLKAVAKARLRGQALAWLKADLALWSRQGASDRAEDRKATAEEMKHWKEDSDLAGVRGKDLEGLPKAEREAWQSLWHEVDGLLARVGAPAAKR